MIKVIVNSVGLYTNLQSNTIARNSICKRLFTPIKRGEFQQDSSRKNDNKALSLIFGEKKYTDLRPKDQKLVDHYQQKKLREDAVVLPNTKEAIEQEEIVQMLMARQLKIWEKLSNPSIGHKK